MTMYGWAALGLMTLLAVACASSGWVEPKPEPGAGPVLMLAGTVHRLDVEGGVWVIRDAQGASFQPTNLPDAFRKEGMAVEAEARRRDDCRPRADGAAAVSGSANRAGGCLEGVITRGNPSHLDLLLQRVPPRP